MFGIYWTNSKNNILNIITIKIVWHNLSFPGFLRIFLFRSYGYAKEKCFGNRKNLKFHLYTILIIIKSIINAKIIVMHFSLFVVNGKVFLKVVACNE